MAYRPGGPLLIAGSSARAAADSARRAGLEPAAIDLFGDRDLSARPSARIPRREYPEGIPRLASLFPPGPFIYTGGLENHPQVIARLRESRPLWGNPPEVLERARDPFLMEDALRRAGLPAPRCLPGSARPPGGRRWLSKPLGGAGGRGIAPAASAPGTPSRYLQERIGGIPSSAVYVGARGSSRLLGLTRQLVGEGRLGARPFAYCGSIGPLPCKGELRTGLERIGETLAEAFGLEGLFGVDLILRQGVPWPVELNPRYTASVEVLERALGIAFLCHHAYSFTGRSEALPPPGRAAGAGPAAFSGKAVLYSRRRFTVPRGLEAGIPAADLPWPGERIAAGRPICTVFADAGTVSGCRQALLCRAERIYRSIEAVSGIGSRS